MIMRKKEVDRQDGDYRLDGKVEFSWIHLRGCEVLMDWYFS